MYTNSSIYNKQYIRNLDEHFHLYSVGCSSTCVDDVAGKPMLGLLRTKVCWFHLRGKCVHGEQCTYAHEISQLRIPPDLAKTRMCSKKVGCNPAKCSYAHSREELRQDVFSSLSSEQSPYSQGPPPGFDTL